MKTARQLELTSKVVQTPGHFVSEMDGEKVMLNMEKGKYYNLGKTGSEIWNLLGAPITAGTLIEQLQQKYDVTEEICQEDVFPFLENLRSEGIITVLD